MCGDFSELVYRLSVISCNVYQTVTLARKCFNSNVSCYLTEGLSNMLFYFELWPYMPPDCLLSVVCSVADQSVNREVITISQIQCFYTNCNHSSTTFEIPCLGVM